MNTDTARPGTRVPTGRISLLVLVAALTAWAWAHRFVQDDAFITFRYAANLVQGHGLVWNPGEAPLEGYTNFLWLLLMAVPVGMGRDPVLWSQVAGVACFVWSLVATRRLAALVLGDRDLAWLAVLVLGANHTFHSFATGGMATQLQAALVTTLAWLALAAGYEDRRSPRRLAVWSLVAAVALLTRPDSALPVAVFGLHLLAGVGRDRPPRGLRLARLAALVLPVTVLMAGYAAWKLAYFGNLMPNTFYAKVAQAAAPRVGVRYLLYFLNTYAWLPFIALFLLTIPRWRRAVRGVVPLVAVVVLWSGYAVAVGGDFMEFRFLVPVLPAAVILILVPLAADGLQPARIPLALGLVLASLVHAQIFSYRGGVEAVSDLRSHLEETRWDQAGRVLGEHFGDARPPVLMATTAAGAIPFYSGLPTVDMLGLNDRRVAREGAVLGRGAGHRRVATADYLLERGVNLVVGHPVVLDREWPVEPYTLETAGFAMAGLTADILPPGARVVEIALDGNLVLHVLCFAPHDAVDEVIAARGLITHHIRRDDSVAH